MSHIVTDKKARPISATISIVVAVCTIGYMLPWMIAAVRGKSNHWAVMVLNLLLGWSGIGWIIALVWPARPTRSLASTSRPDRGPDLPSLVPPRTRHPRQPFPARPVAVEGRMTLNSRGRGFIRLAKGLRWTFKR